VILNFVPEEIPSAYLLLMSKAVGFESARRVRESDEFI
jgi:hypothetical protein